MAQGPESFPPLRLGSPAERWENGPRKDVSRPQAEGRHRQGKRRSTFQALRGLWAFHEGAGKAGEGRDEVTVHCFLRIHHVLVPCKAGRVKNK